MRHAVLCVLIFVAANRASAQLCDDRWISRTPTARQSTTLAYDAVRHQTVMFGAALDASHHVPDTWIWDGGWRQHSTGAAVLRAFAQHMAYDATRAVIVRFDGSTGETWTWNDDGWTFRTREGPAPRLHAAFGYDTSRGHVVLFGGRTADDSTVFRDTWIWNGSAWTLTALDGPPARFGAAMSFDPNKARMILFGGDSQGGGDPGGLMADTWGWDGAVWAPIDVAGPSPRSMFALTTDIFRNRLVLHGGRTLAGEARDTWEWDGASWSLRNASGPGGGALAHDATQQVALLLVSREPPEFPETWAWNGESWQFLDQPAARARHALAFDASRGEMVLFGGIGADGAALADTWIWNGLRWFRRDSGDAPPLLDHAMTYDAARDRVVVFGGISGSAFSDQTWEWNGVAWSLVAVGGPSPRSGAGLVFDPLRHRCVLLGGATPMGPLHDVWEWAGHTWTLIPAALPISSLPRSAAFDTQRGRIVVIERGGALTHEFDGAAWESWSSDVPHDPQSLLAYDPARRAVVRSDARSVADWHAGHWTIFSNAQRASGDGAAAAFDTVRGELAVFAGRRTVDSVVTPDLFTWRSNGHRIARHPSPQVFAPGVAAIFGVQAFGSGELQYQWRRDGKPLDDGGNIRGATSDELVIDPASAADFGSYDVVVNGLCGELLSRAATLGEFCGADLNGDHRCDIADLEQLLTQFGTPGGATRAEGDLDADADVDLSDLAILLSTCDVICGS